MKIVYVLGIFLLFGLAFCEEETEASEDAEQPEVADDETEDEPEQDEESSDEDEESDDEEDDEDSEDEIEDASKYGHRHGRKCRKTHKRVCNRRKICRPKWFYVKGSRKVRFCTNKLLKKTRKECRKFCWYAYDKYYKHRRVCKRRCYRVPLVKKVCEFRRIFYPTWKFKNVCKTIKQCFKIPVTKCRRRRRYQPKY